MNNLESDIELWTPYIIFAQQKEFSEFTLNEYWMFILKTVSCSTYEDISKFLKPISTSHIQLLLRPNNTIITVWTIGNHILCLNLHNVLWGSKNYTHSASLIVNYSQFHLLASVIFWQLSMNIREGLTKLIYF